jgi:crotonobetainyl-CoA:carnitine CoA-transferase CaiB-like acyl-CoA transferase
LTASFASTIASGMQASLPLQGIKVLDLCDQSGAYCGKLLADLGADVVLVESPDGSPMRRIGPFHPAASPAQRPEASLFFWHFNAGKRSVTLDLEAPAGQRQFLQLAAGADLVVESFSPGSMRKQQVGYDALSAVNSALVLTSITAFGQTGPYSEFRGSDLIAQALGGLVYVNGLEDAEPLQGFGLPAYHTAAVWAAIGSLLALLDRQRTGCGQWVDISVHACATAALEHATSLYRSAKVIARRNGALHWTRAFRSGRCRDGHIAHGLIGDWTALAEWVSAERAGRELNDAVWADPDYRYENHEGLFAILDRWAAGLSADAVAEAAQLRRLPYAALQPLDALLSNPQVRARNYFLPVDYDIPSTTVQQTATPFRFRECSRRAPQRAPHRGEHNSQVLGQFRDEVLKATGSILPVAQFEPTLRGLRVLDFTWAVAGPLTTRILADQGAEVIKVERPGTQRDVESPGLATNLNRGKKSIAIDMAKDRGLALVRDLIAVCDVVVDNFSPRVLRNWGLAADTLHREYPRLIAIGMSAFGASGPFSEHVGYGPTLQAAAGHSLMMWQRDSPAGWGFSYSDVVAGHMAALATLTAVWQRQQTGRGQWIDLSQFETLIAASGPALLAMQAGSLQPPGNDSQEAEASPHGVYRCADEADEGASNDRWCAIAVFGERDWQRLVYALGSPAWTADHRFATHAQRRLHRAELDAHLLYWTRQMRAEEVMSRLQAAGITAGIVANAKDLCERDPQLRHRGYFATVRSENGRCFEVDGAPLLRAGEAMIPPTRASRVGEHTDEILSQLLRCDPQTLTALRRDQIVA